MKFLRAMLIVAVAILAVSAVSAQTGGLVIKVVDSQGPLPGAQVTITNENGYVKEATIVTNKSGVAEFPVLRAGGGFVIEVAFPGMATQRLSDLRIKLNERLPITVQLQAEFEEVVKVIGESDTVELEKTQTSTKFSDDFIQDLPVAGRFYQNVLTLAPGVQDADGDGNPNVHGSRDRDFKAVVSGVSNVDPLTGQFGSQVNPNSIEEMEVITAGAGVEYSRAQGGFANIIEKQGSNNFEGVFEFFYRSSKLDGDGAGDNNNVTDPDFDWFQPSAQISGPLIKDKLWYRLSHELIDQEIPINVVGGVETIEVEQGIHSDQLTWQASPRNKLAFTLRSDPRTVNNVGVNSQTPADAARRTKRSGSTYQFGWQAPVSPKIFVDSRAAWFDLNTGVFPTVSGNANDCVTGFEFVENAQCFNAVTSELSGSFFQTWDDHRQRLTIGSQATIFGGNFWGMSHEFRVGFEVENERYFRSLDRRPNLTTFVLSSLQNDDMGGDQTPEVIPLIAVNFAVPQTADVRATGTNWGIFLRDQFKPIPNLSITAGVRVDREEINANGITPIDAEAEGAYIRGLADQGIDVGVPIAETFTGFEAWPSFIAEMASILGLNENAVRTRMGPVLGLQADWEKTRRSQNINLTNTNIAPRLSVSWDPWNNGKTKFVGTVGRFYDKLFLNIPLIELEPTTTSLVFDATLNANDRFVIGAPRDSIGSDLNVSAVDRNLRTPYQDEFTFSFERELWAETSISLTYVNRAFRDQLQDIDVNHLPGDLGRCRTASLLNNTTVQPLTAAELVELGLDPALAPGDGILDDCAGEIFLATNADDTDDGGTDNEDPLGDTTRLERPDGIPDLYVQNPGWGDIFVVGNFNKIDYDGVVLSLTRRQYKSWEMQASYTYSRARGNGEDFQQRLGDDRSLLGDESGYQSYDQRHVVKLNATTITPWNFRLGTAISWESGLPYSLLAQKLSFNQVPPQLAGLPASNAARTRQTYLTGQRNDQRNAAFWNVNVKFTKEMRLSRGMNMQVSAEVFNLLNDDTLSVNFAQINGNNIATKRFGRQWQLGIRLSF